MNLKEKIQTDTKEALRQKDELRLSVLRMLLAAIKNRELEKRAKLSKTEKIEDLEKLSQLTDQEILGVVSSEVKKRKDAAEEYSKAKRSDLAEQEKKESEILFAYLPEQMPEEEISKLVKEAITKSAAQGVKDIGKVMAVLMPQIKGRADGSLVNRIVRQELGG